MVGTSYSNPGLAEWSYEGWKRKDDGREAYTRLRDTMELRDTVNMKCRKS